MAGRVFFRGRFDQYGTSMVWAEPVTGSSVMPAAAQIYLGFGCKPPDLMVIAREYKISNYRKVVLCRYLLHE